MLYFYAILIQIFVKKLLKSKNAYHWFDMCQIKNNIKLLNLLFQTPSKKKSVRLQKMIPTSGSLELLVDTITVYTCIVGDFKTVKQNF